MYISQQPSEPPQPQAPTYIPISYHYYPSFSYVSDIKENENNDEKKNDGNPPQMILPSIVTAVDYNPPPPPPPLPQQQQPQIIQQLPPPPPSQPSGPQIIEIKDKSSSIV